MAEFLKHQYTRILEHTNPYLSHAFHFKVHPHLARSTVSET